MTTIKKAYVELIALLEANQNRKVSSILEEAKALCASKNASSSDNGSTFMKNEDGEVIAIFCYYHKKWEPLCEHEYGLKAKTASGYNTMCKQGVSDWTKQQHKAKKAKEALLERVTNGELAVEDLAQEQEAIEEARKAIIDLDDTSISFDSSDDCLAYINS